MARYTTTIRSSLSPTEALARLADFSSAAEWDPGVASARRLDEGPAHVGSRVALVARVGRRSVPLTYEVVELVEGERVVHAAEARLYRSLDTITIAPHGDGALVTYDARLEGRGGFALAEPLLALALRRIGDRARAGLERYVNP